MSKAKQGTKHDNGKAPCDLLSPIALMGTAMVLGFGAKKYAAHNWRLGLNYSRIIGAIMRHLFAFMLGEDLDPETKLPHVHHLGCEIMFLQELYHTRKDLDDRYQIVSKNLNFQTIMESFEAGKSQDTKDNQSSVK